MSTENAIHIVEMTKDFVMRMGGTMEQAEICGRVLERQPEGSVCIVINDGEAKLLENLPFVSIAPVDDGLFIIDRGLLYTRRNWKYEQCVKDVILKIASNAAGPVIQIPEGDAYSALKKCQRQALELMCSRQFSILTGGPGTGKTYTIARAVKLMQDSGAHYRIGIAAPTGKAAARVGEAMKQQAQELHLESELETSTIHSLLNAESDFVTFKHNEANPLELDWLIVDEASMIDLPLMAKLLQALPKDCRLTLVGDANQLASVELGRVFGDLCKMPQLSHCIVQLNESSRFPQGGEIDRLSEAVKNGNADEALAVLHNPGNQLIHCYQPADKASLKAKIVELFGCKFAQRKTANGALNSMNDCRILCAVRKGPYGCEHLSEEAGRLLGESSPIPTMITRNDHALGVSNGDVGVIMPEHGARLFLQSLDGSPREIPLELIPDRETAFATTIHKSQGSEFQDVIIVLPPDVENTNAASLLTREILYTAITRTKGQVFIFADDKTIRSCCQNCIRRVTGLLEL